MLSSLVEMLLCVSAWDSFMHCLVFVEGRIITKPSKVPISSTKLPLIQSLTITLTLINSSLIRTFTSSTTFDAQTRCTKCSDLLDKFSAQTSTRWTSSHRVRVKWIQFICRPLDSFMVVSLANIDDDFRGPPTSSRSINETLLVLIDLKNGFFYWFFSSANIELFLLSDCILMIFTILSSTSS